MKNNESVVSVKLPNRIEDYFNEKEQNITNISTKQLFSADKEDVELKTELLIDEISLIERLSFLDIILERNGLLPLYDFLIDKRERLKISLNRKSREEFVNINKNTHDLDEQLNSMGNISNILQSKK